MIYYEFEYKNKFQKMLWNLNALFTGMLYMLIGFAIVFVFNSFLSTFISTLLLAVSSFAGLVISIYNCCKKKGVYLFKNCIEISSVYTKKTMIHISEITNIRQIEKYGIIGRYDLGFKGGGRTDVLEIYFKNIGRVAFKINNQNEFLEELQGKLPSETKIEEC